MGSEAYFWEECAAEGLDAYQADCGIRYPKRPKTGSCMISMQQSPGHTENLSPSRGLLNYELPLDLDEMNLLSAEPQQPGSLEEDRPPALYYEEANNDVDDRRKRSREAKMEDDSLEHFLRGLGREAQQPDVSASGLGSLDDEKGKRLQDAVGRDPSAKDAARTKAGRERARRERLNESFAELSKVLEPGKAAKTDKSSIITDAIRIVTQLRAENGQLRQLNKFLEERVGTVEKQKNDLMMQQAMMQQQGESSHMMQGSMLGTPFGPGGVAMGQPVQGMPAAGMHAPQMSGLSAMGFMQTEVNGGSGSGMSMSQLPPAGGQGSASLPDYSSMPSGSGLVPGMPMRMPWLPPATMDTSRDSIRRPPAA